MNVKLIISGFSISNSPKLVDLAPPIVRQEQGKSAEISENQVRQFCYRALFMPRHVRH